VPFGFDGRMPLLFELATIFIDSSRKDVDNHTICTVVCQSDKFNRDLEERSRQRAAGKGGGYVVGVVVLGGLLFGPFGMLFGNQIGASLGAQNALNKARQEELARMGVNQEMLDTAQEIGFAISQSIKGLEATKQSLWTHQSLARPIDRKGGRSIRKGIVSHDRERKN
jgi:hypothetical protein